MSFSALELKSSEVLHGFFRKKMNGAFYGTRQAVTNLKHICGLIKVSSVTLPDWAVQTIYNFISSDVINLDVSSPKAKDVLRYMQSFVGPKPAPIVATPPPPPPRPQTVKSGSVLIPVSRSHEHSQPEILPVVAEEPDGASDFPVQDDDQPG